MTTPESHDIPTPPAGLPLEHDSAAPARRRRTMVIAGGVVALALLGAGVAAISGAFDDAPGGELDLTQQSSVATTFVQRYALRDPAACDLATEALRASLARGGRCGGVVTAGAAPTVTVLVSRTCGNRHGFSAEVTPPGAIGGRYLSVGLELDGARWAVRTVLPLNDRAAIRDYDCAAPATGYGGS